MQSIVLAFLLALCNVGNDICCFIDDMSCETGEVSYQSPAECKISHKLSNKSYGYFSGSEFQLWWGCYASQMDMRACLGCFAVNGYHSISEYEWLHNNNQISENTPLLYASSEGLYTCVVKACQKQLSAVFKIDRKVFFKH